LKSSDTTFFFLFSFQVPFIFQGSEQVFENRGRAIMNNFSQTLNGDDHNAKKSEKTEKRKEVSGGFFLKDRDVPQGSRSQSNKERVRGKEPCNLLTPISSSVRAEGNLFIFAMVVDFSVATAEPSC